MAETADSKPRKRAVVVIHGIGNQAPLATLRRIVDCLWVTDKSITGKDKPRSWSKPELMDRSYELRRIATDYDRLGIRTDFFEFYWAHLMEDTRFSSVLFWLKRILWRKPANVPAGVMALWFAAIAAVLILALAVLASAGLMLLSLWALPGSYPVAAGLLAAAMAIWGGLWWMRRRILMQIVGDAARYLTATPDSIAARSLIRSSGLELLENLHKDDEYERIILVGHSLGAVVGYDLLTFLWSNRAKEIVHDQAAVTALKQAEAAAAAVRGAGPDEHVKALTAFRAAQRAYARCIALASGTTWKITDFVTLGSPLTHASFLLVKDDEKLGAGDVNRLDTSWIKIWYGKLPGRSQKVSKVLSARLAERSLPICPPLPEDDSEVFSYRRKELPDDPWTPHHAAVFAAVRWTNIFAPRRWILFGDAVGGAAAPLFGPGIHDVLLTGKMASSFVAHTKYWNIEDFDAGGEHVRAFREGVNLADR